MAARMKEKYTSEIAPALMKKFHYKSVMQIPKLDKIIVNVAAARARTTPRKLRRFARTSPPSPDRSPSPPSPEVRGQLQGA